jgi:hypothetical protein
MVSTLFTPLSGGDSEEDWYDMLDRARQARV